MKKQTSLNEKGVIDVLNPFVYQVPKEDICRLDGYFKRIFDIFCSIFLLTVFSPFFFTIAMLIKAESRGPVFLFRKDAVGREFHMYKLMY